MIPQTTGSFTHYVQSYFGDYLTAQRDLSPHTVLSYRDAFKLFLNFAAHQSKTPVANIGFEHAGTDTVLTFLEDLEKNRKCTVRTRNARLAALHGFYRYVATREPQVLELCQRISAIPVKRTQNSPADYLEYDEVVHVLGSIDCSTQWGKRDHLLIQLLFETGLRAQEAASLKASSLRLSKPCQLRVLGKGRRERICPLRAATAVRLRRCLEERGLTPDQDAPLFVSTRGIALTRYGVLRIVQRHARRAAKTMPALSSKRIGAHTFRHAAAVHLLRSGNDISVVRSWLGHVSVETTHQYTEIDFQTKRKALEACQPIPQAPQKAAWKKDPDLIAWLEAL